MPSTLFEWINKAQLRDAENKLIDSDLFFEDRYLLAQLFKQLNELLQVPEVTEELVVRYHERF